MARRRYRQRSYRRRGRWSSNIQNLFLTGTAQPSTQTEPYFGDSVTLAQNPGQSQSVSQQYTVKNVEVSGNIETISSSSNWNIEEVTYYIMYVPEGYAISTALPFQHPEWIMAYKYYGSAVISNTGSSSNIPPKIKTRLSRRLNTGDSIIFLYIAKNVSSSPVEVKFQGLVRWWTKAN